MRSAFLKYRAPASAPLLLAGMILLNASLPGGLIAGPQGTGAAARDTQHVVGCWFSMFYENPAFWDPKTRDSLKTPVVGWGDTLVGLYRSSDPEVLRRQFAAARRAGIDFFVLDMTNQYGIQHELRTADSMFAVMQRMPDSLRIKLAVSLGKEFWGPDAYHFYHWEFPGWKSQDSAEKKAVDAVLTRFAKKYPDLYFQLDGKPLIVLYLAGGIDYPPKDERTGKPLNLWSFPGVALRYCLAWTATFADSAHQNPGQQRTNWWGWGAKYPQPAHAEVMSVFPGTYNWAYGGPPYAVDREGGRMYIRSWHRVLDHMPKIAVITDWNNWIEETAIEGSVGPHGWTDYDGRPTYDWYLKITAAYTALFHGRMPGGVAFRETTEDSSQRILPAAALSARAESAEPARPESGSPPHEPVIDIPPGFLNVKKAGK